MGVTVTPLGFRKPDGNEPVRSGDNEIAANAQKAEDLLTNARQRLAYIEGAELAGSTAILVEDPDDPGFYVTAPGGGA
jgi:hypothetical protein